MQTNIQTTDADKNLKDTGCALKCYNKKVLAKHGKEFCVKTETEILSEMRHPFIIRLVKTFTDTRTWSYELLEMVTGGQLVPTVQKEGGSKFSVLQAKFYFGAVFLALEYLHLRHVLYRNVKAEHILLDSQGYPKLIDFTNAKKLPRGGRTRSTVGVPHYMSPEVIQGKPYDVGADYWALGVFLHSMLVGELPFGNEVQNPMEIFAKVVNAKDNSLPALGVSCAADLCRGLLEPKLEQRLATGHVHPVHGCVDIRDCAWFREPSQDDDVSSGQNYFDCLLIRAIDPPVLPPNITENLTTISDKDNKEEEDHEDKEDEDLANQQRGRRRSQQR